MTHCIVKQTLITSTVFMPSEAVFGHFINREVGQENASLSRRLSVDRFGDVSKCKIDRIGLFTTRELSELSLVGGNNERCNCSTFWKLFLLSNNQKKESKR